MSRNHPSGILRPVVKSDSADIPNVASVEPRALLVGTAGTAKLTDLSGEVLTNVPLQQGYNPIAVRRVWNTGTAADIWVLY